MLKISFEENSVESYDVSSKRIEKIQEGKVRTGNSAFAVERRLPVY